MVTPTPPHRDRHGRGGTNIPVHDLDVRGLTTAGGRLREAPHPRSRPGVSAFIGYSPTGGRELPVLAYRDLDGDWPGLDARPASGQDLTPDKEGSTDGAEA
ncbi:MAG TPA: hypothetical protein VNG13_05990 [Mycobacteriales bacterium]|nr:hypothetical protein [Mycobacteriales bacterium]